MAQKKQPLKPRVDRYGLVVLRVPVGTPPREALRARTWAKNLANKIKREGAFYG